MTLEELRPTFLHPTASLRLAPEDFFVLLAHVTGKTREYLIAHPEYSLSSSDLEKFLSLATRRQAHEPVAYLTGHKEFYGLDFTVTRATLIPRPETELVVEQVLHEISSLRIPTEAETPKKIAIADIGTGSGNIIISLTKNILSKSEIQKAKFSFFASDISSEALTVAQANAERHNVDHFITFSRGNLLEPIREKLIMSDMLIIIANLPYLSQEIYTSSASDVQDYEPRSALVSDEQGLAHILSLFKQVSDLKPPHSMILWLEISPEQESLLREKVSIIFPQTTFTFHRDLAEKYRFLEIKF